MAAQSFKNETRKIMDRRSEKIIVALDVSTADEALRLAEELRSYVSFFKIGFQLFTAAGPAIVRDLATLDCRIFLDLKLHDIPNTVAGAVKSISGLGVQMATIHLAGGRSMIEAAVAASSKDLLLLGVTVLTSVDDETLREIGIGGSAGEQVNRMAALGTDCGLKGFVASPREVAELRTRYGGATLVIPGIRPVSVSASDQKRVMTPSEAIAAGADYIVIGRAITAQAQPGVALQAIIAEMAQEHAVV